MRRFATALASASLMTALTTGGALAAPPEQGCPVGPVDAGKTTIGPWVLMDRAAFLDLVESIGGPVAEAGAAFDKMDKNGDGLECVQVQVLPNDASGSDTWLVHVDNAARAR